MQKLFNKILVPVNFTAGSKKLLKNEVDITLQFDCSIHFLHVVSYKTPLRLVRKSGKNISRNIIKNKK